MVLPTKRKLTGRRWHCQPCQGSRQASRKTVIKPKIEPGERCDQTSEIKPGERCDQTLEIEPGESYDQTGEIHPGKSSATSKSSTPPRAPTPSPTARSTTTPTTQIQNYPPNSHYCLIIINCAHSHMASPSFSVTSLWCIAI